MTSHPYVVFVPFTHMLKTYILYCFFHEAFSVSLPTFLCVSDVFLPCLNSYGIFHFGLPFSLNMIC